MREFYEDCVVCALIEKCCNEECFECVQPNIMREGWIHSLGFYFSRCEEEYRASKWSQAIIKAKKKFMPVVLSLGRTVAFYMDKYLTDMKPYVITGVPSRSEFQYLFENFDNSAMQTLACSVFANLKDKRYASVEHLLIQNREKAIKQHNCRTDRQRKKNVEGIYSIKNPEKVEGRNIILLDDVITSEATIRECAEVLLLSGAKTINVIALGRTHKQKGGADDDRGYEAVQV